MKTMAKHLLPERIGGGTPFKIFHCHIWGDVEVDGLAKAVIDTWAFQRLHYIRQTAVLYKVFPTAQTTRFEHAVGSYHLTRLFLDALWRNQPEVFDKSVPYYPIPAAVLCKDLGDGPFSHLFDRFLQQWHDEDWANRSYRTCCIVEHTLTDMTFPFRVSPEEIRFITSLLCPEKFSHPLVGARSWFRSLISNRVMDVFTLDYLLRDCHALGMPCAFDIRRIISNTRVIEDELCFCDRIQDDVWGVLSTRQRLYTMAYHHPKNLEFEAWVLVMLQDDVYRRQGEKMITGKDTPAFLEMTDGYFLTGWIKSPMWRSLETRVFPGKSANLKKPVPYVEQSHDFREMEDIRFYHRQRPSKAFSIRYRQPTGSSLSPE